MADSFTEAGVRRSGDQFSQLGGESSGHARVKLRLGQLRWLGRAIATGLVVVLIVGAHRILDGANDSPASIVIDYPLNASVFPPDMEAPQFEWRDPAPGASEWRIEIHFSDGAPSLRTVSKGEGVKLGEIDPRCISSNNKLPTLTPEKQRLIRGNRMRQCGRRSAKMPHRVLQRLRSADLQTDAKNWTLARNDAADHFPRSRWRADLLSGRATHAVGRVKGRDQPLATRARFR